ncbi:1-acyl-sn-glycerol-3-phosphate acyltransferase beta [Cichlidogyrus casuarinus]|uniref:1-acyl-sn-glycerol-3-phosphate acyltransferase n=1 Tax=Cichlidogyrus casuarinus TaxID=1844966 RepID=A0ABD2Q511_9PLAT
MESALFSFESRRPVHRLSLAIFIGMNTEYVDRHNFDPTKPCIIIPNHQSLLDPLIMADLWPKRCCTIMKESLKYSGPFGILAILGNTYFINRKNSKKSVEVLNQAAEFLKQNNCSIFIFPEGTRGDGLKILPLKKGAFHMAVQTGYPIQPIVVSSVLNFLSHSEFKFTQSNPKVYVLPQISTIGKTVDDIPDLMVKTRDSMRAVFDKTVPKNYLHLTKKSD